MSILEADALSTVMCLSSMNDFIHVSISTTSGREGRPFGTVAVGAERVGPYKECPLRLPVHLARTIRSEISCKHIQVSLHSNVQYYETIIAEVRELEVKKTREASLLVQKKHILIRYQRERDKARMLQRLVGSRVTKGVDTQDALSFRSCMSSVACDI